MSTIHKIQNYFLHLSPMKILLFGYCTIILIGSCLLSLPVSVRNPGRYFFTGFFTATSATCVTGLIKVDTYTHWLILWTSRYSRTDTGRRYRIYDALYFHYDYYKEKNRPCVPFAYAELRICPTDWRNC